MSENTIKTFSTALVLYCDVDFLYYDAALRLTFSANPVESTTELFTSYFKAIR